MHRRRWYLWAVFLGTPPTYSLISNVPSLKHDLATLSDWGLAFIALEAAGGWKTVCVRARARVVGSVPLKPFAPC